MGGEAKREVWRWVTFKRYGWGLRVGVGVGFGEVFVLSSFSSFVVAMVFCDLSTLSVDEGVVEELVRRFLDAGLVFA